MAKQVVNRYNICAAKYYTNARGEQKTQWVKIGTAVMFDDGSIVQNIDCLPTGSWWTGTLQGFKQEAQGQQSGGYGNAPTGGYGQQRTQPYAGAGYQQPASQYPGPAAPMPNSEYGDSPF